MTGLFADAAIRILREAGFEARRQYSGTHLDLISVRTNGKLTTVLPVEKDGGVELRHVTRLLSGAA